jgi:hypothetical protein
MTQPFCSLVSFLLLALVSGCAGSRFFLTAREVEYPVSLSSSLFDSEGRIVSPAPSDLLGHFEQNYTDWAMFYRMVQLGIRERDLSDPLTNEVESRGGAAIVNLTVRARLDWHWFFTGLIPFLPQSISIAVEGDVVKMPVYVEEVDDFEGFGVEEAEEL